jgi:hypothetical protein
MPIVIHDRNDFNLSLSLIASMLLPISVECTSRDKAQSPSLLLSCPHAPSLDRFKDCSMPKTDDGLKGMSARNDVWAIVA